MFFESFLANDNQCSSTITNSLLTKLQRRSILHNEHHMDIMLCHVIFYSLESGGGGGGDLQSVRVSLVLVPITSFYSPLVRRNAEMWYLRLFFKYICAALSDKH